jgi:ubiquinone/menaquinone biosynthesis C-methylase UbiE
MATYEETAQKIFAERAAWYTTSAAHKDPEILARVVAAGNPSRDWAALDIATGTGHTAFALAPHVATVVATDLTPEMLAEARRLRAELGARHVRLAVADAHRLPIPDGAFQLITCRRAAHHFSDLPRALREMRRLLAARGRLVIDDRSVPDDDFADTCMNQLDRWHDESHVRQYRTSEWERFLSAAGFDVEIAEPYVRHRPLSALTDGVSPDNVRRIHATLDALTDRQRATFNYVDVGGAMHLNHWYLLIAATRR